jgi:hypothetical protein
VAYPVLICVLLLLLQTVINNELDKPKYRCGCKCIPVNGTGTCQNVCGPQYSTLDQVSTCPIASPPKWPALMQVPRPEYRAAHDTYLPFADLPDSSCQLSGSCPATVLFTGSNQTLAQSIFSLFSVHLFHFFLYFYFFCPSYNLLQFSALILISLLLVG